MCQFYSDSSRFFLQPTVVKGGLQRFCDRKMLSEILSATVHSFLKENLYEVSIKMRK
jgi:hypothetical protein